MSSDLHQQLQRYPRLVSDLHNERATLFVGAGFSRYFTGLPGWDQLVDGAIAAGGRDGGR